MRYLTLSLSSLALIAAFSGCATSNALLDRPKVDPSLPKPANIKTMSDRTSIGFEWDYINDPAIEGYKIYRNGKEGSELVATIKDRYASHYADKELKPDTLYSYRFSSLTPEGVESDASTVVNVKTKPLLEKVSFVAAIDNLPNRTKIIWRPHPSPDVVEYTVQKSGYADKNWEEIAKVSPRLMAEHIDPKVESGKEYYYRVIAKTFDGLYAVPSDPVSSKTKNLPMAVTQIYATKDKPKMIEVTWEAAKQKGVSKYNLYSSKTPESKFDLVYSGIERQYVDKINEDGAIRYYKVATLDKDGLESNFERAATGMTRPKPPTPIFSLATIRENRVVLAWTTTDKETVSYNVTKKWGGMVSKQNMTYRDIKGLNFEDRDVDLGTKYNYFIEAVDKDGLVSLPSDEVELFVPKGL